MNLIATPETKAPAPMATVQGANIFESHEAVKTAEHDSADYHAPEYDAKAVKRMRTRLAQSAKNTKRRKTEWHKVAYTCLLYTSPSPRDLSTSRMPSSA